jgi:hypothetical protein
LDFFFVFALNVYFFPCTINRQPATDSPLDGGGRGLFGALAF